MDFKKSDSLIALVQKELKEGYIKEKSRIFTVTCNWTQFSPWFWLQTWLDENWIKFPNKVNTEPNHWIWVVLSNSISNQNHGKNGVHEWQRQGIYECWEKAKSWAWWCTPVGSAIEVIKQQGHVSTKCKTSWATSSAQSQRAGSSCSFRFPDLNYLVIESVISLTWLQKKGEASKKHQVWYVGCYI